MAKFSFDNLISCRIEARKDYKIAIIMLAVAPVLIAASVVFYLLHSKDFLNTIFSFFMIVFAASGIGVLVGGGSLFFRTYSLRKLVSDTIRTGVYAVASIKEVHVPYGEDLSDQEGIRYALTLKFECDGKQEIIKTEYLFGFAQLNNYKDIGGVPVYYSPLKKEIVFVKPLSQSEEAHIENAPVTEETSKT